MTANSKIEWTDHTFNPWIGCQKVSPGCDHCYAEALMDKRYHKVQWGPHGERKLTSEANWKQPRAWDRAAKKAGVRHRVFCASLADWLDNKVPNDWRLHLANLIEDTPNLDWLMLTKRIENFEKLAPWARDEVPDNVWMGVTAEDQAHYDNRWPILREIEAPVLFISHEPSLGCLWNFHTRLGSAPDWIICGGESGPHARMMDADWARTTQRNCHQFGIAFFMKQMTGRQPIPDDLLTRQFPAPRKFAEAA